MEWAFRDCVLSEDLFQLSRAGRTIKLEPKVFRVFCFLIENHERVVSKGEILNHVWPGEAITESVLPRAIAVIRRAVGDTRSNQNVIETVHGHGYRFVASIETLSSKASPTETPVALNEANEESDFVGRKDVLKSLEEAFEETKASRSRIILLVGEPGIGKTRTIERHLEQLVGRASTYVGSCFEGEGAPSYWPFVQILRALIEATDNADLADTLRAGDADLLPLVPELAVRLPAASESEPLEGEQTRFRLFDSLAGFLKRSAKHRPLVLVLEDLHWADHDSVLLMSFLSGALRDSAVSLIGTYRDVDVHRDHPLGILLRDLARAPHCERIPLRGLDSEESKQLLQRTAGMEIETPMRTAMVEMTEGNPFFLRELALLLAEGGRFNAHEHQKLSLDLPQGIRDAVGLRLESLSEACNQLLRHAAVIGRDFNSRVLADVSGKSPEALLEMIGESLAAGIVTEHVAAGTYAFSHALVRQTLYSELSLSERVLAHRRTAAALERIYGDQDSEHLAELAFHLFESAVGGDPARSVELSIRAAELAHRQCAYDESVRHRERALEALDLAEDADPARRCELLLAEAEARWDAGQRERSHEQFGRAAGIARELNQPDLLARAAVGMRSYGDNTRPGAETVRLLEEALEAIGNRFPTWRARILSRLTYCDPHTRTMENRRRLSDEAAALVNESVEPSVLFDVFVGRYWATLGPDALEERISVGREATAVGERLNDPRLVMLGHDTLVGAHLVLGEFDSVSRHVDAFGDVARGLRQPFFEFHGLVLKIICAMNCGRFDEAQSLLDHATHLGRGSVRDSEALSAGIQFWLRDMRGELTDPADAEKILKVVGSQLLSSSGTDQILKASIIEVCLAVGQHDAARQQLHELSGEGIEALSRNENWLVTMSLASSAAIALEESEIAERLFGLLVPYEHLMFVHDHLHISRGSVASSLGALAGVTGLHDEGVDRLRAAIDREEAMGAEPAALDSRILLIQQFERMGQPAAAQEEIRQAKQAAQRTGSRRIYRVFPDLSD